MPNPLGRPNKCTASQLEAIKRLHQQGLSSRAILKALPELPIGQTTICYIIRNETWTALPEKKEAHAKGATAREIKRLQARIKLLKQMEA